MTRYAFITGANGGIGRALCSAFSDAGYAVIATDIAADCDCRCAHYIALDLAALVRNEGIRDAFIADLDAVIGSNGLAVLLNNAALQRLGSAPELSLDDFTTTMDVNVTAPFLLTQIGFPYLDRERGCVINIGSIHARLTKPRFAAYATSKAAIDGLTRTLAVDIGDRVRVNAINPAAVATDMLLDSFTDNRQGYNALESYHPTGRIGQATEIAELALFLASNEKAGFLNGATIDLSGGIHARLHDPD